MTLDQMAWPTRSSQGMINSAKFGLNVQKLVINNHSKRELVQRTKIITIIKRHSVFCQTPFFRALKICDFEALNNGIYSKLKTACVIRWL